MTKTQSQIISQLQADLIKAYREEYSNEEPDIFAFAPGRVNLIGEHVDYNDGFVFPMAIPLGTMIAGKHVENPEKLICSLRTLSSWLCH